MNALDLLAQDNGIQETLQDARGNERVTTPETKRAILKAMGIDASDDASALIASDRTEDQKWNRPIPAVVVTYKDLGHVEIPIVRQQGTDEIHWLLKLEDGTQRCGRSPFEDLPLVAKRDFEGGPLEKRILRVPAKDLPLGYHKFRIASEPTEMSLIISPGKCWLPEMGEPGERYWGIAAQVYLLRSEHNWGIGDFSDLSELIRISKEHGADVIGVNPLHAMFPDIPEQASPYSPSDRNLLNVLNIDVEAIPEFSRSEGVSQLMRSVEFRSAIIRVRDASYVAYAEVAKIKLQALKLVFEAFERQNDGARQTAFTEFVEERPQLLERACIFQALRAYFADLDPETANTDRWPQEFQNYHSAAVARWAGEHHELVRFHLWMQWVADTQLRAASEAAGEMRIGIYRDLAVGADPSGAEVWCHSDALLKSVHVGAPPDIWNPKGQDWGLPAFHPKLLEAVAYQPFIDILQSNMRYCGALRIDHAMALQRLYWISQGQSAEDGAYVQYPLEDLLGILALESHRNQCLIIGEDLGTVPAGFRERMTAANILSYRVLIFEKDEQGFVSSEAYPHLSLSVASSHDLPTLRGWWREADLDTKESLGLFPTPALHDEARMQRGNDRSDLLQRLRSENLFKSESPEEDALCDAAHTFLGKTTSLLTLVQLDDLTNEREQVNIPGTTDQVPNWRRKYSLSLEDLADRTDVQDLAAFICGARPNSQKLVGALP
jgi:4-alpha-glucanotransferase